MYCEEYYQYVLLRLLLIHIVNTTTCLEGYSSYIQRRGLTFGERGTRSQLFPASLLWSRMGGFPMMKISSLFIDT